ncbi:MAG: aldose 1-epimerase family protein [Olsenella sp.]|nr:aldose 1-epimerase family protein [Olsenella sp.]
MPFMTSIASNGLTATIDSQGAQLMSLTRDGGECLWQGDERWWPRRAPVLFPIVGSLRDDRASSSQGEVSLGRHGLARNREFELVSSGEASARFRLCSDARTRESYPYDFRLELSYSLADGALTQTFEVTNTGDVPLPFVLGGHPAFNVPQPQGGDDFDSYRLEFAREWTYASPRIDPSSGLLDFEDRLPLLDGSNVLRLTHRTFDVDTLVFQDVPERFVRLVGDGGHGVEVAFEGFDYLGVWSAAGDAPFVALEPWTGCATALDEDDVFEHKRGMTLLSPCQALERSFCVRPF